MKRTAVLTILITMFSLTALAKSDVPNAIFIEAKDIQWEAIAELPGVSMANVEGSAKGSHHAFMKFNAGFSSPMHHHTADHYATVVAGTMVITVDGEEHRLPPGSFFALKKKQAHATMCAAGAECIISTDVRGKWDVVTAKKLVTN